MRCLNRKATQVPTSLGEQKAKYDILRNVEPDRPLTEQNAEDFTVDFAGAQGNSNLGSGYLLPFAPTRERTVALAGESA